MAKVAKTTVGERIAVLAEAFGEMSIDVEKFEKGNNAAATRLRQGLLAARKEIQEIRIQIQDER